MLNAKGTASLTQDKRGKKGQKQSSGSGLPSLQQYRTPEERFKMKQDAQAQGKEEPDAAFEQRLEALRKTAKIKSQVVYLHAPLAHSTRYLQAQHLLYKHSSPHADSEQYQRSWLARVAKHARRRPCIRHHSSQKGILQPRHACEPL